MIRRLKAASQQKTESFAQFPELSHFSGPELTTRRRGKAAMRRGLSTPHQAQKSHRPSPKTHVAIDSG